MGFFGRFINVWVGGAGVQARLMERTPSMSDFNEVVYGQVYTGRGGEFSIPVHTCVQGSHLRFVIFCISGLNDSVMARRRKGWEGWGGNPFSGPAVRFPSVCRGCFGLDVCVHDVKKGNN